MRSRRTIAALVLTTLVLAACATDGMSPPKPAAAVSSSPEPMPRPAPDAVRLLDFPRGAIHVLVDDFDGNGRPDLAFTSHGGNRTDIFLAEGGREFRKAQTLAEVGFHPNDLVRWPFGESPYWIANGEGKNALVVFGREGQGLKAVAEHESEAPRSSAPFLWAGAGHSLAVTRYSGKRVDLLLGFDPLTGTDRSVSVETDDQTGSVSVGNLGRGEEVLVTNFGSGRLWAIGLGASGEPAKRLLWDFGKRMVPDDPRAIDIDNDGRSDLVVRLEAGRSTAILVNRGEAFEEAVRLAHPGPGGPSAMAVACDRDGSVVIVTGGTDQVASIYRLSKAGDLRNEDSWARDWVGIKGIANSMVLTDLDGDGWLDLAMARSGSRRFKDSAVVLYGPLEKHWSLLEGL